MIKYRSHFEHQSLYWIHYGIYAMSVACNHKIIKFWMFFCRMLQHFLDEHEFVDAEPEEVARRGHHHQTRSRQASLSHQKLHPARSSEETAEKKQATCKRCISWYSPIAKSKHLSSYFKFLLNLHFSLGAIFNLGKPPYLFSLL